MNIIQTHLHEHSSDHGGSHSFVMRALDEPFHAGLARPHSNSFFQMIIIRKGHGKFFIGFEQFEVQAPSICFIFPRQVCSLQLEGGIEGDVIMFDESIFCSAILSNELKEYNVELYKKINYVTYADKLSSFDEINQVKTQIQGLARPLNNIRQMELKFFTKIIIFKIIDSVSGHEFSANQDQDFDSYIRFRRLIEENHQLLRKVDEYCKKLGISPKKLNLLCKKYARSTALELIHERVTLEIKKRLIFDDMPLKELAYTLGFDSQSSLNKYITSKFSCSPSELKTKLRAENTMIADS